MLDWLAAYWQLWLVLYLLLLAYAWYNNAWRIDEIRRAQSEGRAPDLAGTGVAKRCGWRGFLQCGVASMLVAALLAVVFFVLVVISLIVSRF